MKKIKLGDMATPDLVARFAEIGVAQDVALLGGEISKFNRLFDLMEKISSELKLRMGDQRSALISLFQSPNMQVRLNAAKHTLAVAPVEARAKIQEIADSHWFPQAGDAGMCLVLLDDGTFKPS
jgi:hypothetical protein